MPATSGRRTRAILVWLVAVAAAWLAACGGTTVSGSNGGNGGQGNADTGSEAAKRHACIHYFASQFSSSCRGAALPDGELSRLEPLFERSCVDQFAMPGASYTADDLESRNLASVRSSSRTARHASRQMVAPAIRRRNA